MSVVKPLFKKDKEASMTNCRSIALLTTFAEVLEMIIYNRLSHHMHINNTLVPEQFSFQKGTSTGNAAFSLMNSVFKSIN
jgi:hypothetical protein